MGYRYDPDDDQKFEYFGSMGRQVFLPFVVVIGIIWLLTCASC
jgi:hypothetical protein